MLAPNQASGPEDDPMPSLRLVDPDSPARFRIAAHLATGKPGSTGGTFVATGLVADSGVLPELERFSGLRHRPRGPLVVQGAESFAGVEGRIAIAYDGVFRRSGPGSTPLRAHGASREATMRTNGFGARDRGRQRRSSRAAF